MTIEQINPYLYSAMLSSPRKTIEDFKKKSTHKKVEKVHASNNTLMLGRTFDEKI
jgi:hypothetical protein